MSEAATEDRINSLLDQMFRDEQIASENQQDITEQYFDMDDKLDMLFKLLRD